MRPPPSSRISAMLVTPPIARIVPSDVFDAFGWCSSDELEWGRPSDRFDATARVTSANPARMAFVMREDCDYLPRELARLHVFGLGLGDEWALAPWGIDAATDALFEHRRRPGDLFWLAAESIEGLTWGLHDWAHFHNHGPFEARAWTELQCDATALVWLWLNRRTIGLGDATWERVRLDLVALSRDRFASESLPFDETLLAPDALFSLADR